MQHHEEEVAAIDVGVQGHEEEEVADIDDEANDDTIEAPAFRQRGTRKGHFILPPSALAQSEANGMTRLSMGMVTIDRLIKF